MKLEIGDLIQSRYASIRMGFPGVGVVVSRRCTDYLNDRHRILWLNTDKHQWEFATDLKKVEK